MFILFFTLNLFFEIRSLDQVFDFKYFENRENVIVFEELEFLNLIQLNTEFQTQNSKFEIDFTQLNKDIFEKFLQFKPRIDLKVS